MDDCSIMLSYGPTAIPPSYIDDFIATREGFATECPGFGKDFLLECDQYLREMYFETRDLALNPPPPVLQNTDGEPLQLTTLNYDLNCTPLEALTALASLALVESAAELEQTGELDQQGKLVSIEFPWLKKGNEQHESRESTVLGNIIIEGYELSVDVNSQERAYTIRRKIERRLGHRAQFRDQEILPVEDLPEAMQNRPSDEEVEEARQKNKELAALPEVQARLQEMTEAHWNSWLDKPLPILRYETPREAAETATGRERLEALFWQFEWQPTGDNAFAPDIPRLKKNLGME